jgi:hypothetical protein
MTRFVSLPAALALVVLAPAVSSALDVCGLEHAALNSTVEKEAAAIADYYSTTAKQLSLNEGGSAKKTHAACNWECSSDAVITPLVKAFGFLQYNCRNTTAPVSTRRPTGLGTKSQMGLSITDEEYRDAADAIFRSGDSGVGDLMRVPSSIVNASKSGKVQDVIDAVNAISGASWLKFSSTSVDNDDDGAARILIHVPDSEETPRFEQWIQIAINNSGGLGRNVDFVARRLDTGPPEVSFRGYSRTSGGFVPEGGSSRSQLSKCYSCHPSGLRPIVPAPEGSKAAGGGKAIKPEGTMLVGEDLAEQLAHVKSITSHLAVFGPTGYVVAENGPHFGPSDRAGRAEFVAAGCGKDLGKELDDARQAAIVEQMDCETCHNGSDRGVLNASTSRITIFHKVAQNTEAPMPPGVTDSLSAEERTILFKCLKSEYAQMLGEWLRSDLLATFDE